jgi:SNF2 family DNA or RNA helicase
VLYRGDGSSALPDDFAHQAELVAKTWERDAYAVFWQMGCGKTRPTIQTFARWFTLGRLDGVIVIAPDGVHRNWPTDELPAHCAIPWIAIDYHSSLAGLRRQLDWEAAVLEAPRGVLPFVAVTYDAIKTASGIGFLRRFAKRYPRYAAGLDESSRCKNGKAERTKVAKTIAHGSTVRRILSGTPVSNGPRDIYSQMEILDPAFWKKRGIGSLAAFESKYCVKKKITIGVKADPSFMAAQTIAPSSDEDVAAFEAALEAGTLVTESVARPPATPATSDAGDAKPKTGRTIEVIVGYRNLDHLNKLIESSSSRLTKEEAGLNLPPKLYQRIPFELAPEQRKKYDALRRQCLVELDGGKVITATMAIVKILRLHQIACGYLPSPDDPDGDPIMLCDDGEDPRFEHFKERIEDTPGQVIIWCRFTLDVNRICAHLGKEAARYDGLVTRPSDRAAAIDEFRKGNRRYFVAKPSAIGMGVTLVNTHDVIYYSNSFVLDDRLQSEDRCHRIGQHNPVTYADLEALHTVDSRILTSLRSKHDVAAQVVGDAYREWLTDS